MPYRTLQVALLLSVACLLAVESGQLRDQVRHDTSNGYSAEVAEEVVESDCRTDILAIFETSVAESVISFGSPSSPAIVLDTFYEGPPLFLRGPPLS